MKTLEEVVRDKIFFCLKKPMFLCWKPFLPTIFRILALVLI